MFVGLRPVWNIKNITAGAGGLISGGNQNVWRDWHRMTRQVDAYCDEPDLAQTAGGTSASIGGSNIGQVMYNQYWLPVPTVDSLTLTSHGITIYENFQDLFFSAYMPFNYGGPALVTPDDPGAFFGNMAPFPRSYQPSGHLNISRARETYIKWSTNYVSANTPCDLLVVAIAINFLLINTVNVCAKTQASVWSNKTVSSRCHTIKLREHPKAFDTTLRQRCM